MSILRALEARGIERRGANPALAWGDTTPVSNGMLGGAVAGTNVTEKTALSIGAVYGSVGVLIDAMVTSPLNLYSGQNQSTSRKLKPSALIANPYAEISPEDWIGQYTMSLALRGNFFGKITARDENLYPSQIQPIHPDHARVARLPNGTLEYRFWGEVVPIDDVFHIRLYSVPNASLGLNPIEYLKNTLGLARAADMYGASFFQNSAHPAGYISVPGELDEDEVRDMQMAWNAEHQGIGQSNRVGVLTGDAKWNQIQLKPEDMQFIQSRGYSASEISGFIFRVPPHMIGMVDKDTSWGAGIEQQELGFVRNTLSGYMVRLENAITRISPPNQFARFDLTQRLRGDAAQRAAYYQIMRVIGAMNSLQVGDMEGIPRPTDPTQLAVLSAYDQPFNSSPMKPPSSGAVEGDKAS